MTKETTLQKKTTFDEELEKTTPKIGLERMDTEKKSTILESPRDEEKKAKKSPRNESEKKDKSPKQSPTKEKPKVDLAVVKEVKSEAEKEDPAAAIHSKLDLKKDKEDKKDEPI